MRYSLTSLLIVVFLIALVMALWVRREPWELTAVESIRSERDYVPNPEREVSPDRTRIFRTSTPNGSSAAKEATYLEIADTESTNTLSRLPIIRTHPLAEFVDNDTVIIRFEKMTQTPGREYTQYTYRRRFPEWWWGHFYRPEVWLSLFLIGVILTRIARNQLQAEKESGVQDSV